MTKPHQIRKKAQEFAKKRQWDKAINEYIQLAEIEANNPNVFNELGDLHLKIGNKGDAFRAFHSAIDAYSGMGLFNNAVAVCKKLIRLSPSDSVAFGKLARLRSNQGIKKEAASYAISFLELIAGDVTADPEETRTDLVGLANEMDHAPEVLERVAEYLLAQNFAADAGGVLEKLAHAYAAKGMTTEADRAVKRMEEIGFVPSNPIPTAGPGSPPSDPEQTSEPPDSDISSFEIPSSDPIGSVSSPGPSSSADAYDFDSVELGESPESQQAPAATQTEEMMPNPTSYAPATPPGAEVEVESDQFFAPGATDTDLPPDIPTVPPTVDELAASAPRHETGESEFIKGDPLSSADGSAISDPANDADTRPEDGVFDIPAPEADEIATDPASDVGTPSESGVYDIPAPGADEFTTDSASDAETPSESGVYDIPAPGADEFATDSASDAETPSESGVYDIPAPGADEFATDSASNAETLSESGVYDIPAPEADEAPAGENAAQPVDHVEPREADENSPGEALPETPFLSDTPDETSSLPPGPTGPLGDGEVWVPKGELPGGLESKDDGDGGVVNMSDLVDHFSAEVKSDVDAEDYRSHYDLGMAYLEMDLITEAIREFQFAANSSMYRPRSLELIGMCFIKQNQPRLAIKQLEKGLALIGDVDRDSIGLQYNLGLAYEMIDNVDKAKRCFEEVYVLDVSFRDICEKIAKYTS